MMHSFQCFQDDPEAKRLADAGFAPPSQALLDAAETWAKEHHGLMPRGLYVPALPAEVARRFVALWEQASRETGIGVENNPLIASATFPVPDDELAREGVVTLQALFEPAAPPLLDATTQLAMRHAFLGWHAENHGEDGDGPGCKLLARIREFMTPLETAPASEVVASFLASVPPDVGTDG